MIPVAIRKAQLFVLKQPVVWIIALRVRRCIHRVMLWVLGLYCTCNRKKTIPLIDAGVMSSSDSRILGAILSGIISDKVFNANRHIPTTFLYGLANIVGMCLLFWGFREPHYGCLWSGSDRFSIGGLVVFLAGLTACDLMPKNAVKAQWRASLVYFLYLTRHPCKRLFSKLIVVTEVAGVKHYDFGSNTSG